MAGNIGFLTGDELLNFLYRGTDITIGSSLWLRLLVVASNRSGTGATETTYSGYARKELPRGATIFSASASGVITNSVVIEFPQSNDAGNGDLVAFDIVDTSAGAINKRYHGGPISPAKIIQVGKKPTFRAGALVLTF
jgi:hypothetical protein